MAFIQRGGGRLLARLARGVSAETATCSTSLPLQSQLVTSSGIWNLPGVRWMASSEESSSRSAATAGSHPVENPEPPPPGTPPLRSADDEPRATPSPPSSSSVPPASPPASSSSSVAGISSSTAAAAPAEGEDAPSPSRSTHAAASESLPPPERPAGPRPPTGSETPSSSESSNPTAAAAANSTKQPRSNVVSQQEKPKPTSKTKPGPDKVDKDRGREDESRNDKDAEAGDNVHTYHAFWRDARMRKMQPMIEEGMRMNAYEGLQGYGGFMGGPDRAWSFLYDSPSARLMAAAFAPLWSAGVGLVRPMVLAPTEDMIRDQVDHSFDATEFVDSVSQAPLVFFNAVAAEDSEALCRMCTPRALEALDRDRRRLREELGLQVTRVDTQVRKASLAGANLWSPDSIRGFDPAWASDLSPNLSKSWLVVGVYLEVTLRVSYKRVGNGGDRDGDGGGGSGAVWGGGQEARQEFQLPVRRWGTWFMARGPLPKGPAESLDCPWKLLAWY